MTTTLISAGTEFALPTAVKVRPVIKLNARSALPTFPICFGMGSGGSPLIAPTPLVRGSPREIVAAPGIADSLTLFQTHA